MPKPNHQKELGRVLFKFLDGKEQVQMFFDFWVVFGTFQLFQKLQQDLAIDAMNAQIGVTGVVQTDQNMTRNIEMFLG